MMSKKRVNKLKHDLDRYCIFCIVFFVLYSITEIAVSSITGVTHDRLTEAIQWFCGGELFFCAMLKRLKIKKGGGTVDSFDRELASSIDTGIGNSRCD